MLWRLLVRQRAALGLAIAVGLVWTAGKVAVPQLTRLAVDRGISVGDSVLWWAGLIIIAGVITGVFTATRRYLAFRESRLTEARLREQLFNHILSLHVGYHDRSQTGQLMSRASSDLNQIQAFVVMIPLTVSNIALILAVIVVMVVTDPLLALVALVPLPFVNWTARRFSQRIHPAVLAVQAEQAQLATVVEESIAGVRVVKGFGAEEVLTERLETEADDIRSVSLRAAALRATYLPLMELLPTLAVVGVLGIGGLQVLNGSLSVGALVAFSFYVALLIWPLRTIGMTVAFAQRAAAALVRVHEVLGTVPAVMDPNDPVPLRPGRSAEIHFDRVGFGYGAADAVLRDLELHVDAGTSVAIVGTTGSGKSTIARLLLRFYDPDHGSITLGGVDLRDLRLADLRSAVGVVFEDTLLFSDTVAANIAFALPDADLDTVRAAARLAGADEFIAELAEGYDTLLGERGYSLSGGQRQRIAIARAIVADPQVLVLDDATSAVDPSKEHEIRDAMRTVMAGRTTVIIAHRPATIALADRVLLLDEGRIVASGTDAELRRSSPRYREVIAAMDEELGDDAGREGSALDGSAPEGSASTESEHGATGWS